MHINPSSLPGISKSSRPGQDTGMAYQPCSKMQESYLFPMTILS
ncbi:hypothetical protein ASZ90_020056 [hydrocarbon metagenome]|uniref:Uncharacterized protein n=1 Tax=hydrocarbon metagenome TaxID=938273 RepID=A0A0W8E1N8_9ZZZZ